MNQKRRGKRIKAREIRLGRSRLKIKEPRKRKRRLRIEGVGAAEGKKGGKNTRETGGRQREAGVVAGEQESKRKVRSAKKWRR